MVTEPLGLILAGGLSTRMNGKTKAEVRLGGQRLIDLCADRLEPQVRSIVVNSNTAIKCEWSVIPDTMSGHLGPLAGVLAGLEWAKSKNISHIVTAAVDTPFFPCDLVPRLWLASDASGFAIAATADGEHGTFGLWPVTLIAPLTDYLAEGGRKMRSFTTDRGAGLALFPETEPPAFYNINTPDDLEQARAWI